MKREELESAYRNSSPSDFVGFMNLVKHERIARRLSINETQNMLCSLVAQEVENCRAIGMRIGQCTSEERETIHRAARLVACTITVLVESHSRKKAREMALLLLEYASYVVCSAYDLVGLATKCLSFPIIDPGFSWIGIEVATSADMLVYNMVNNAVFNTDKPFERLSVGGNGSISLSDGVLRVSSTPKWEAGTKAFSMYDDAIEVCTKNSRDEKIKMSNIDDAVALDDFARVFAFSQTNGSRQRHANGIRRLVKGEKYAISQIKKEGERLYCTALGTTYDGKCELCDEELTKGIFTLDLYDQELIYENDCIEGAVLTDVSEPPLFSIKDAYTRYSKETADRDIVDGRLYEARIVDFFEGTSKDKDRAILLSDKGYGGLMKDPDGFNEGETVIVKTSSVREMGADLFINMDCVFNPEDRHVDRFDNDSALLDFIVDENTARTNMDNAEESSKPSPSEVEMMKSMGRIMARPKEGVTAARYRSLMVASFISRVVSDEVNLLWTMARAEYLNQCMRIAEGVPVRERKDDLGLTEEEKDIIDALLYMDKPDDIAGISALLNSSAEGSPKREIAQLLMINALSKSRPDEIKATSDEIRMKICRLLGVDDHFRGERQKGGGKYGKGEMDNVEFKSSYVFSNRDGQADLDYQGRGQVFEAVCAFLNKNGGTVFIGVNNSGDPIKAENHGLNGDLKWFEGNFDTIRRTRSARLGHPVPQPKDLDTFCLFLNDERSLYFKPEVCRFITISPTEDMDAIRIVVEPSRFEIAKLYKDNSWKEGIAYVRDGGATVPMSRLAQQQRLMELRSVGKVEEFIITLTEAIDKQRKVILRDYCSSRSNDKRDRFVVPINLVYNNENLWAYDLEERRPKEYRLSRIGDIDTDIESPEYAHAFPKGEADIFRWVNDKVNYHIKLDMSLGAYNNLKEEYSNTENLPEEELYSVFIDRVNENGEAYVEERKILDTTLHGLGAVCRFYLGLAKEIDILDTEDKVAFLQELRRYKESYLDYLSED